MRIVLRATDYTVVQFSSSLRLNIDGWLAANISAGGQFHVGGRWVMLLSPKNTQMF